MAYNPEYLKIQTRCLQCGQEILYGRADRKFCSDACKNQYHNRRRFPHRELYQSTVLQILDHNHSILLRLWKMGVKNIDLLTLTHLGFNPYYITCFRRLGRHNVCAVFDMQYEMTPSRIKKLESVTVEKDKP